MMNEEETLNVTRSAFTKALVKTANVYFESVTSNKATTESINHKFRANLFNKVERLRIQLEVSFPELASIRSIFIRSFLENNGQEFSPDIEYVSSHILEFDTDGTEECILLSKDIDANEREKLRMVLRGCLHKRKDRTPPKNQMKSNHLNNQQHHPLNQQKTRRTC